MSDNPSGLNDLRWFGHNCKIGGLSPATLQDASPTKGIALSRAKSPEAD